MDNIVNKYAHRFYIDSLKAYATTFDHSVRVIDQEYNYPVSQMLVKIFLNSLRIHYYVSDKSDTSMALAKVHKLILKLSRQVPVSHHGDA